MFVLCTRLYGPVAYKQLIKNPESWILKLMAPCERNPLMTGVSTYNGLVMQSFGLLLGVGFLPKRHGAHVVSLLLKPLFIANIIPGVQ